MKARILRIELRTTMLRQKTMCEYLLCIKCIVDELGSCGDPALLREHLDAFLEGLPKEYSPVISMIESKFEPLSIGEVEVLLLAHEARMKKFQKRLLIHHRLMLLKVTIHLRILTVHPRIISIHKINPIF